MGCSSFRIQAKMFLHLVCRKMATCQIITMTIPIMLQENDSIVPSGGPSPDRFVGSTLNLLHCSVDIVLEIKLFMMKTMIQRIFSPSRFLHNCKLYPKLHTGHQMYPWIVGLFFMKVVWMASWLLSFPLFVMLNGRLNCPGNASHLIAPL
jgi:hypothetical protein